MFIIIKDAIYPLDTPAEHETARQALRDLAIASAPVYVGDPDSPDCSPNGQILYPWTPVAEAIMRELLRLGPIDWLGEHGGLWVVNDLVQDGTVYVLMGDAVTQGLYHAATVLDALRALPDDAGWTATWAAVASGQ